MLETFLQNANLQQQFDIVLLDIADRRGLTNMGRLDKGNTILALRHGLEFLRLLVLKHPDIVYICIAQNTLGYLRDSLFLIPARLFRRQVVVHLHGSDFGAFYRRSPAWMRGLIRWTLGRVRRAIVLGQGLRKNFDGLVPVERVMVLPNGIRPISSIPGVKEPPGRASGACRVVYLGTLQRAKGFLDVLHSVPLVVSGAPNAHFILAGEHWDPDEIQLARDFIQQNQLQAWVEMPGVVVGEDKARLLQQADVFVFPPVAPEGQPLVILEAMSASLPVIATSQGAISETVVEGVTGFLVPPGDPTAIAEKVICLVRDQDLRLKMGQAGHERFLEYYSADRWAGGMARIFHEVLEEG